MMAPMPTQRSVPGAGAGDGLRTRMTGAQRRAQLVDVSRGLFAERGYDGTSVEEVAVVHWMVKSLEWKRA